MLDRIQISRCLDIYGVVEEIHEITSKFVPGLPANERIGIVLIDNITNPLALLMQRGQSPGHDLMVSLSRNLTLLSRTHGVCVMLVNATVKTDPARHPSALSTDDINRVLITNRESAFADVAIKPALGNTWPHLIDHCLFIHPVPEGTRKVPGKRGYIQEVTRSRNGGVGDWRVV